MKKSEAQALGPLLLIGIVAYPFIWLHEKFGWGGITVLGGLFLGGIYYWNVLASRNDKERFNKLVLYILHNRIHPEEARKLNHSLSKTNFRRATLIRRLQILRDSIEIALTSNKRDTAESRMTEVKSSYEEIRKEHADLVAPETLAEIDRVVSECEKDFGTSLYTNIASALIEKAQKLKTNSSKAKYATLAMEAIVEGLENPKSEKRRLEEMKKKIEQFAQSIEMSS